MTSSTRQPLKPVSQSKGNTSLSTTAVTKRLTALQGAQDGDLADMKLSLANLPRDVLRNYFANLKPGPTSLTELEKHTVAVVKKLNKTMKRCKRKLGIVCTDTSRQLDESMLKVSVCV